MKLTELKCTACNGTLKLDEKNPHIAVCEYCRSRYVLEDEGEGNVRLSSQPISRGDQSSLPHPGSLPGGTRRDGYGQELSQAWPLWSWRWCSDRD